MRWLTEDARLVCKHQMGTVQVVPTQSLVTIGGRRVLVTPDPEGRPIKGCPVFNPAAGMRPCVTTLRVRSGYSAFLKIEGRAVCLDSVVGNTDGTPPMSVDYVVNDPGQSWVGAVA
jgi:hypothetical protein